MSAFHWTLVIGTFLVCVLAISAAYLSHRIERRELIGEPVPEVQIYPDYKPALGPLRTDRRSPVWLRLMRIPMYMLAICSLPFLLLFGVVSAAHFIITGRSLFPPKTDEEIQASVRTEFDAITVRVRERMREARRAAVFHAVLTRDCQRRNQERRDAWNELTRPRREYEFFKSSRSKNGMP